MLGQPSFVTKEFFGEMKNVLRERFAKKGKSTALVESIEFEEIFEGTCVQMLHVGRYADEDKTFHVIEDFAFKNGLNRVSKAHKEVYLSDFRKVPEEKLRTTLRFKVKSE